MDFSITRQIVNMNKICARITTATFCIYFIFKAGTNYKYVILQMSNIMLSLWFETKPDPRPDVTLCFAVTLIQEAKCLIVSKKENQWILVNIQQKGILTFHFINFVFATA